MPLKKKPTKKKSKAQTPIHPGKMLEKFLTEYNLTPYGLAKEIKPEFHSYNNNESVEQEKYREN